MENHISLDQRELSGKNENQLARSRFAKISDAVEKMNKSEMELMIRHKHVEKPDLFADLVQANLMTAIKEQQKTFQINDEFVLMIDNLETSSKMTENKTEESKLNRGR